MECKNCELKQRQFYCETCLRNHLRDIRLQTQRIGKDRDDQVAKASRALKGIEGARSTRAGLASCQKRMEELVEGLARLKRDNDAKRERLRQLRESLAARRRTLSAARLVPTPPLDALTTKETQELHALSAALARARSGLVHELVEVFHVVEVGGRPPIGAKAGTKGEWTIGDLILPVPGDIRRYPPDHINAVITHTIHFLGLLTFYLGVKLPFETEWSGKKFGVGQPWIVAGKGGESGSWGKWTTKHPLHLTASSSSTSSPSSPPTPLPTSTSPVPTTASLTTLAPPTESKESFTTAFAMLLYNVCYLAHTQSVEIPLSQAGDALGNLWVVCCSGELGRRSHETTPGLPPPTPPSFPLDFAQVLQATTASPARKDHGFTPGLRSSTRRRPERIAEEEGWEVVEDDGAEDGFG
ncbi:UV radiation resistance protein and autophagy-related subunit 14-domain-containing protein [Boletus edulis BED1]|uniref:Autophagy-related protein 14 n=1 Tax=Boletus edulis BED1 TaxID=1328754 RepID=A0AAD4G8T5_BOLED|nr:UV radiation resistance protein and autophagy-related subunit 14-domain-containing protein [Boletus edulis BED1]